MRQKERTSFHDKDGLILGKEIPPIAVSMHKEILNDASCRFSVVTSEKTEHKVKGLSWLPLIRCIHMVMT